MGPSREQVITFHRPSWFRRPVIATVLLPLSVLAAVGIDPHVSPVGQHLLGVATLLVLVLAVRRLDTLAQLRVLGVVIGATIGELLCSIVWGLYTYRLHNVPLYVPPGHALVYLTGIAFASMAWTRRHERALRIAGIVAVATWMLVGITAAVPDQFGFICGIGLIFILVVWQTGLVYVGVFAMVAMLEPWGIHVGAWQWHAQVPYLPLTNGSPPSGIATGYVLFESVGICISALLAVTIGRRLGLDTGGRAALPRLISACPTGVQQRWEGPSVLGGRVRFPAPYSWRLPRTSAAAPAAAAPAEAGTAAAKAGRRA